MGLSLSRSLALMKAKKDRVGVLSRALSLALELSLWGTAPHLSYCGRSRERVRTVSTNYLSRLAHGLFTLSLIILNLVWTAAFRGDFARGLFARRRRLFSTLSLLFLLLKRLCHLPFPPAACALNNPPPAPVHCF